MGSRVVFLAQEDQGGCYHGSFFFFFFGSGCYHGFGLGMTVDMRFLDIPESKSDQSTMEIEQYRKHRIIIFKFCLFRFRRG